MDILWFKPFFNLDFDRKEAKDKFSETYEYMKPVTKDENMIVNVQENNSWFFRNEPPKLWCDGLSKPFSRIHDMEIGRRYLMKLKEVEMTDREMKAWLRQRGLTLEMILKTEDDAKKPVESPEKPKTASYKEELPITDDDIGRYTGEDDKLPSGLTAKHHKQELIRRRKMLEGTGATMCPMCFSAEELESKGSRKTKEGLKHRLKCWKCGFSGYDEKFKV